MDEYVDEKSAFKSLVKQHTYQVAKVRDKDKKLRDQYVRSFFHRSEFQTKTLAKFKTNVNKLNSNKKAVAPKHKDIIKQEKLKHQ